MKQTNPAEEAMERALLAGCALIAAVIIAVIIAAATFIKVWFY